MPTDVRKAHHLVGNCITVPQAALALSSAYKAAYPTHEVDPASHFEVISVAIHYEIMSVPTMTSAANQYDIMSVAHNRNYARC